MKKINIEFDNSLIELFFDMEKSLKEYSLKRLNSVILLKALLEEKNSVFYECLCATCYATANPYKQIIADCDKILKGITESEEEVLKEKPFEINIPVNNKKTKYQCYATSNFYKLFNDAIKMALSEGEKKLYSSDMFIAILNDTPKDVLSILKDNGVFIEAIKNYYEILLEMYSGEEEEQDNESESEEKDEEEKLPMAISDFATILTAKYKGVEKCEILGRDKECRKIMRILQKRGRKNVVLIGEPGVGKSAIAEKIAYNIANGNCPECLKNHIVIQVDVNNSVAGTKYRGMAEERFKLLIDYLNTHDNVILFIDEIHMVIDAGATSSSEANNMANALKPFLAGKKAKVIGATTEKEYERYFLKDEAFDRRFEKILVKEPKSKEVAEILKNSIKAHEEFHGVKIEEDMVEYAILISSCFNNNTHNPDRTNDLIDCAMVIAKEQGKEYVDRRCILENFDINFEKFEKLEKKDKFATAYHEAGHYLVWRKSGRIKDMKGIAVSIMPADNYLGITVYDDLRDEITIYPNEDYCIDSIAKILAGRVAEKKYTLEISLGASSDLEKATKMAYDLIARYGMSDGFGNRIFLEDEDYHMLSESIRNDINKEVKEIIDKATKRAEDLISLNEKLLKKLVDALMEKGILDEKELEEICKEYD